MNKPDFHRAKTTALSLLLKQEHTFTLAMNVLKLKHDREILIDDFESYAAATGIDKDYDQCCAFYYSLRHGCTIKVGGLGVYVVLYDGKELNRRRLNWSLAHEIGHIYLDHELDESVQEVEANHFASQLLIPDALILSLLRDGISVTEDFLYRNFYLSRDASRRKMHYIENHIHPHETDRAVEELFRLPLARIKALHNRKKVAVSTSAL